MAFIDARALRRFDEAKYQKVNLFATERMLLDIYCLLPGQAQKVHAHAGNDKVYYILEGQARVRIGAAERELGPGEAALATPGVEHGISNAGPEPLVALVLQAPRPF